MRKLNVMEVSSTYRYPLVRMSKSRKKSRQNISFPWYMHFH